MIERRRLLASNSDSSDANASNALPLNDDDGIDGAEADAGAAIVIVGDDVVAEATGDDMVFGDRKRGCRELIQQVQVAV